MTSKIRPLALWTNQGRMPTLEIEMDEVDAVYRIKKLLLIQERLNLEIQRLNTALEGPPNADRLGNSVNLETG